ncbi:MAG TPA: dTDP-4-dehydrorhamnose reductase [Longimicrobiaceae bacterium]|jgi:dTDP-4-dehydrorhamnose reductase
MKVLVTGAAGMLAHALVPLLRARGHEVVALDRAALDVADRAAVHDRVLGERPDAVVQCAAYTAVDRAEDEEAEATRVNADAARHVAEACDRVGAAFVYPSTDYVFAGTAAVPYRPGDPTDPVNAYGRSKLAGERAALASPGGLVVRTSWLYGAGGSHFVDTILRLAREGKPLRVVDDQWGRPTWTGALAEAMASLMEAGARGIFHATGGGEPVSWHGFAREVVALGAPGAEVAAVGSAAFPRPARRPAWSVLDCSETEARTGAGLPHWRASLAEYLQAGGAGA